MSEFRFISSDELQQFVPNHKIDFWRNETGAIANLHFEGSEGKKVDAVYFNTAQKHSISFASMALFLSAWLPSSNDRIVWIASQNGWSPNSSFLLEAAWRGFGADKSIQDSPGMIFKGANFSSDDISEFQFEAYEKICILASIVELIIINHWYGWLFSSGCNERIEIWEDYLFFHSDSEERLKDAEEIARAWGFDSRRGNPFPTLRG